VRSVVCEHDQSKEAAFWVMVETQSHLLLVSLLLTAFSPNVPRLALRVVRSRWHY
jgi:hypothetical protein